MLNWLAIGRIRSSVPKAKIILDYYSRRYVNAIFNDRKHSKQFKSDLWSVKEVLYVLDLHDGDIDGWKQTIGTWK